MKKYCVYCHQNKINGKRYIGITCQKPEDRWRNGTKYTENKSFTKDILSFGWHNFTHEILYTGISKEEAESKERLLIKEYDTTNPDKGYNMDFGGIKGVEFSDTHKIRISNALKGKTKSDTHKQSLSKSHIGNKSAVRKKVICIETNEIFESINEAERQTEVCAKNISAACLGKRNSAGGFHWEFAE